MNLDAYIQAWIEEAPALAASIVAVLTMVGVAALLGFRQSARIDEASLQRLAAAEGLEVESAAISTDATQALARLAGDKLLIARAMGADISTRIAPLSAARIRRRNDKVSIAFADTGFPPLDLQFDQTPAWLARLASGDVT